MRPRHWLLIATALCGLSSWSFAEESGAPAPAATSKAEGIKPEVAKTEAPKPEAKPTGSSEMGGAPQGAHHFATSESPLIDLTSATPDSLSRVRDPFQKPEIREAAGPAKTELQKFPIEQLELLGVISGPVRMRAMFRSPDSRTHLVGEKAKIGTRNGYIKRITTDAVVVRERVLNLFGQEEEVDTELKVMTPGKGREG